MQAEPKKTPAGSLVGQEYEVEIGPVAHGGHCIARWAGSTNMTLFPDGTYTNGNYPGTWTGNAVAWTYTSSRSGSSMHCTVIAGT